MWRSQLYRQFLLMSLVVAVVAIAMSAVITRQMAVPNPNLQQLLIIRWVFTGMLVVLILLFGLVSVHLISGRINRVLEGMTGLRRGEYPHLVAEGDDELTQLTRGFNQTVEELRIRDEKLKAWSTRRETEMIQLSQSLEQQQERLETVLDSIGDGVVVLDGDGKVLMANRRVAEIFGVPPEVLTRMDLPRLVEQVRHRLVQPEEIEKKVRQLQRDPSLVEDLTLELDEPGTKAIRLYSAPVRGVDGKVFGRIATALDLGRERELERLKSEFISTISHELRTPLTSIKGALGLIRGGATGSISADTRELLEIALDNTDRLIHVINEILDIFQLERGTARIRPVPMELSGAVEGAIQAVAPQAENRRISFEKQIPAGLPGIQGDPRRVEQVLVNLLSNAIKFSNAEAKVVISAQPQDHMVVVSVADFGRGMSPDFLERLFTKFEHAQGALTRESQGAGLGLAICRHIVEAHGGRIWAESQEGAGSTFHFSLPAVDREGVAAPAEARPAGRRLAGPRLILVIDDDEDVARVISYVFESQGHRVICAHSGREAIELARKHRPDMLTLDLIMPDLDGFAVLRMLRSNEETRTTPIICISVQPDAAPALAQGADFYLEKPVDIEKLRKVAAQALATL